MDGEGGEKESTGIKMDDGDWGGGRGIWWGFARGLGGEGGWIYRDIPPIDTEIRTLTRPMTSEKSAALLLTYKSPKNIPSFEIPIPIVLCFV
jgi:hypothetical protein